MSRLSAVGFPDERDAIAESNERGRREGIMGDQSRDGIVVICGGRAGSRGWLVRAGSKA